jgi:hypothetical protein
VPEPYLNSAAFSQILLKTPAAQNQTSHAGLPFMMRLVDEKRRFFDIKYSELTYVSGVF